MAARELVALCLRPAFSRIYAYTGSSGKGIGHGPLWLGGSCAHRGGGPVGLPTEPGSRPGSDIAASNSMRAVVAFRCRTPMSQFPSLQREAPELPPILREERMATGTVQAIPIHGRLSAPVSEGAARGERWVNTMELVGRIAAPRVSVVIPALNEADNLRQVLPRLPGTLYEVVLVDGGSIDDTVEVTRSLCPGATIVRQGGRGKGNALSLGFAACRGDIIVMLDADGSADPGEIAKFVKVLQEGTDFAKGTRFSDGGDSADITWYRRIGHAALLTLANWLHGTHYTDLCYGMNAFWAHCLPHMAIDCDGFEVETLINLRLARSPLEVREVGSVEARRIFGNSKLRTVQDGFRVLGIILAERWRKDETRNGALRVAKTPELEPTGR